MSFFEDRKFSQEDFPDRQVKGEFEYCNFINCNLEKADLSQSRFVECRFENCNLSNANIAGAVLNGTVFIQSKLLGLSFENCDTYLFSPAFENCTLNFSSFFKRSLKACAFSGCQLQECDFTDADLTGLPLNDCDLLNAKFENTNLEKADLRTALNFTIDPNINRIRKAKFSLTGLPGLLSKYDLLIG